MIILYVKNLSRFFSTRYSGVPSFAVAVLAATLLPNMVKAQDFIETVYVSRDEIRAANARADAPVLPNVIEPLNGVEVQNRVEPQNTVEPIYPYSDVFEVMAANTGVPVQDVLVELAPSETAPSETVPSEIVPSFKDVIASTQADMAARQSAEELSEKETLTQDVVLEALSEVPLDQLAGTALMEEGVSEIAGLTEDVFGTDVALQETGLRTASGGTASFAVDLDNLGVNINESTATLQNNTADGAVSGQIVDNVVSGNSGFTTVVFNSGNQVIFQNAVQVNIFSGPAN